MQRSVLTRLGLGVLCSLVFSLVAAAPPAAAAGPAAGGKAAVAKASYPLDVCVMSGEKLQKPVVRKIEGREVQFCCTSCIKGFKADTKAGFAKLDSLIIAKQKPGYPLAVCLVSGGKLGEMGAPVDYVYDNQLIRFCCPGCIATFKKDPAQYLAKLQQAYAAKPAEASSSQ